MTRKEFIPRPWQPPMLAHLVEHPRSLLLAKMGAGKTGVALRVLRHMEVLDQTPVLILGPKRVVVKAWTDEVLTWKGLEGTRYTPIVGNPSARFNALEQGSQLFGINYENLPWLIRHYGKHWPFKTVVADECTHLKSLRGRGGGTRAAALARIAHRYIERWIGLTGTPSPNGLQDLWGQMWFVDQGQRLGRTYSMFKDRWFRPSKNGYGVEPWSFSQREIEAAISDVALTIDPADYLPLQSVIETIVPVALPAAARRVYTDMEKQLYTELVRAERTHEVEAVNAAARTTKCLQIASGAVYDDDKHVAHIHDAKLDALHSIVEETGRTPLLVAYQYQHERERILRRFPQAEALGADSSAVDRWNAGKIQMLLAHPASAGHGLSMQHGGNILVDFSSGWNLEHDEQIIERLGPTRQYQSGYDRPVYRYRIVAERTVDEIVSARRESKRDVQDLLLEALKRRYA